MIEKYGSGIKRIQQQFIAYGLKSPVFENFQHGFRVVVVANNSKVGVKVGVEADDKLSVNQNKILALIQKDSLVTAKSISTKIGISLRKAEENLRKLREMERIKRVGPDKTGHWELVMK